MNIAQIRALRELQKSLAAHPALHGPCENVRCSKHAMIGRMKIATWNVNGIRARETQLCEWLARDRPDIVCLQELKAEPAQIPESCKLVDYHAYWHGVRGYSGVSLHVSKGLHDAAPEFSHPEFDMETRIVQVALGNL